MKKIKNIIATVLIIIFLIIILDFFGIYKNSETVTIDIPIGSNPMQISRILKESNLIRHPYLFTFYSVVKDAKFQAGTHHFDRKSYNRIFKELSTVTGSDSKTVTITEGMEQREIAELLEKQGVCSADEFNQSAKLKNFPDYWFLNGVPEREYELEGYLFPDTYEFAVGDKPENVIKKMLDNFELKISEDIKKKASETDLSFDEIVTFASIIEREAATDGDYKLVSGIFHNRLNLVGEGDGYLRSCATVQYILKERKNVLSVQDTKIKSPYNTYINIGLPVGPIASPGIKTIEAVLYPDDTEYLYFASDSSGKLYYARTYSEHQANMRKAGL